MTDPSSDDFAVLRALGSGPMQPSRDALEAIPVRPCRMRFRGSELTSVCPVTEQPDFYTYEIVVEGAVTIETKSLKLYLRSWDRVPVLAEALCHAILDDLEAALRPKGEIDRIQVTITQNVRGGVELEVSAER